MKCCSFVWNLQPFQPKSYKHKYIYTRTLLAEVAVFHTFRKRSKAHRGKWYVSICFKGLRAHELETEVFSSRATGTENGKHPFVYMDIFISQKYINLHSKTQEDDLECFRPITKQIMFYYPGRKAPTHSTRASLTPLYTLQLKHCL